MEERESLIYIDRRNTDCYKWDGLEAQFGDADLLPLWVADMDFQCPAAVRQAVSAWAAHGVFGYYKTPDRYFDAFLRWEREEHGFSLEREWVRFSPGIVSALYWAVQLLTEPGDAVTVLTPVYYPFLNAVKDNARIVSACPLKNEGGIYSIDFEGLERLLDENGSRLLIFSSPHNPVGRVWTREELVRLCRICEERDVVVLSDEIHQDLILGDKPHIPTASLGIGRVITCCSASKTFNIAGLKNSFIILPDDELRASFDAYVKRIDVLDGPSVGYVAATAAFEGGKPWLRSLLEQVRENYQAACGELLDALPGAVISPLEGTYLMWVDLRDCLDPEKTKEIIQDACGLAVDYGEWFGGDEWKGFIRLNLATSMDNVMLAVRRITAALTD